MTFFSHSLCQESSLPVPIKPSYLPSFPKQMSDQHSQNRNRNVNESSQGPQWLEAEHGWGSYPMYHPYFHPHIPSSTVGPYYGYACPITPSPFSSFVPPHGHGVLNTVYDSPSITPKTLPMPPLYGGRPFPYLDFELHHKIINQVNYYFSDENLIKDIYLRQHMDVNGWVHITVIAGFKRMVELTKDTYLIRFALKNSTVVEVQGDQIRKQKNWSRWILQPHFSINH